MRIYRDIGAARRDAHPGVYIMVESTGPVWALMSVSERERVLNGGGAARRWSTVERARPFHDVAAEADTGWHDYDDGKTDPWHSAPQECAGYAHVPEAIDTVVLNKARVPFA